MGLGGQDGQAIFLLTWDNIGQNRTFLPRGAPIVCAAAQREIC